MNEDRPKAEIDPTLPETVRRFLEQGALLESIRLDARGNWTHEGLAIDNPRIVALFNRSVSRTSGGTWILEVGPYTYPIEVEDTGFFVEQVDWSSAPPQVYLSDESSEPLDAETLRYAPEGRLYCAVKSGAFEARFKRAPYHDLMERLEEEDGTIVLTIGDGRYPLADMGSG
jgi:uncharacterized protein